MKYAIMSDVHANPRALKVALEDARRLGCEKYVLLGDVTGYGYDVKTALAEVRKNFDVVLMGNHDSACVGLEPVWEVMAIANYDIDRAQREKLSDDEVAWLQNRPYMHEENGLAFAHGDFTRPQSWNYILSTEAAVQNFFSREERLLFCGHTHHAAVWEQTGKGEFRSKFAKRLRNPAVKAERISFKLKEGSRYIVNVGSVGYPRNDLCASYAIYDKAKNLVTLRRLPFDFKNYIADMIENKVSLPDWLVALLTVATKPESRPVWPGHGLGSFQTRRHRGL